MKDASKYLNEAIFAVTNPIVATFWLNKPDTSDLKLFLIYSHAYHENASVKGQFGRNYTYYLDLIEISQYATLSGKQLAEKTSLVMNALIPIQERPASAFMSNVDFKIINADIPTVRYFEDRQDLNYVQRNQIELTFNVIQK